MKNVALITFNFNEYENIRTHYLSDKIEHIYISDKKENICGWKNIQFNKYNDSWANTLYVRYNPFEFTDKDYVIIIDGSLTITNNIDELVDKFISSNCDIGVLLSHQIELNGRLSNWISNHRITLQECSILSKMLREFNINYKGSVSACFKILHKSNIVQKYLDKCWNYISTNGMIRLDEIPSTLILSEFENFKIMPFSNNLIQGDVFVYHHHNSNKVYKLNFKKDEFWLNNKPITPLYIGKCYERIYKYKSEAMCLTRFFTENELRFWIDYHLKIGFEHIHIFDNESQYPCEQICKEYGDIVSYEFIKGNARHYKIFDEYVNSEKCKSEWVIPIDDDEYFELNKNVCSNINECIDWYKNKFPNDEMFAIRWKHLFPKKFHTEPTGNILEYCTEENIDLAATFQIMGDRGIKTIVHRKGYIHYEETEENPCGGHVPVHSLVNGARLYNGQLIRKCSCQSIPREPDEPARLIHCRYKGYNWYKQKNQNIVKNNLCLDNTSGLIYTRNYKFNEILDTLD